MKLKLKSRRDIGLLVVVVLLASAVNVRALEGADAAAFIRALGKRTVNLLRDSQGHAVLRRRRPESAVPKRERGHYEERIC